jgi:hypothetical protein
MHCRLESTLASPSHASTVLVTRHHELHHTAAHGSANRLTVDWEASADVLVIARACEHVNMPMVLFNSNTTLRWIPNSAINIPLILRAGCLTAY